MKRLLYIFIASVLVFASVPSPVTHAAQIVSKEYCASNHINYIPCGEDICYTSSSTSGAGATSALSAKETSKDNKTTIQKVIDDAVADAKSKGVSLSVVVSGDTSASGGAGGQVPSASVIKLLVAAALSDKKVPLSSVAGDLTLMIRDSNNDAANRLIDKAGGFAAINATASRLGADATIGRKMLAPAGTSDPNRISAQGSDAILNAIKQSEGGGGKISQDYASAIMSAMKAQTISTKWGSSGIPKDKMAHKTGELNGAQHDVGYFFDGDKYLVVSTLTNNPSGSSEPGVSIVRDTAKKIYDTWLGNESKDASPSSSGSGGSLCCSANSGNGTVSAASSVSGSGANGLTAEQVAFVDKYHDIAEKLSIQYGIPWEAVMAQGILESGAGTSDFAVSRNNFFGINAVDNNPGKATTFSTPEEGWKGYYDFMANNKRYREQGVFSGANITDPYAYIKTLKAAGYATDPQYVDKNTKFIKSIEEYSKTKGWKSSADLSKENPEMLANAQANAQGGKASDSNESSSGDCSSAATPSGDIADVAKTMGNWGVEFSACYTYGGGHGRDIQWLQQAIDNHFTGNFAVDCSAFVRAVIYQATKTDPGDLDTSSMCNSPNYERISRDQAQPGDLAIDCANHVEVITDVNGGSFRTVGSHQTGCGAGFGASPGTYQGTESFVLRYKG